MTEKGSKFAVGGDGKPDPRQEEIQGNSVLTRRGPHRPLGATRVSPKDSWNCDSHSLRSDLIYWL